MAKRFGQPDQFELPLSGVVLGVIVRALKLSARDERGVLGSRTTTRYFDGERISDDKQAEIIESIARTLGDAGFFDPLPSLPGVPDSSARLVANFLAWLASQWDGLVGHIRSLGFTISSPKRAAVAPLVYLRLLVIEVALRAGALLRLTGSDVPPDGTPDWARRDGQASQLRSLMNWSTPRPKRVELEVRLEVHQHSVDAWLAGKSRPTEENIAVLAEEFADRIEGSSAKVIAQQLRRHYALHDLAARLATRIGWEEMEALGARLFRYTRLVHGCLSPAALVRVDPVSLFLLGTRYEAVHVLLEQLWEEEPSRLWQTDIRAACEPWLPRLHSVARDLSDQYVRDAAAAIAARAEMSGRGADAAKMAEMAELLAPALAQIDTSMPMRRADVEKFPYSVVIPADDAQKAANRVSQARQCVAYEDYEGAVAHARRAVDLQPNDAEAHYTLGCCFNHVQHYDEAINECWIAATLRPHWEPPILEIGIIYGKMQRFRDACDLYARYESELASLSPVLLFEWGAAHMRLREVERARDKFERVLAVVPEHAYALDACARCYFLLGDPARGQELAKKAHLLGQSTAYEGWRAGAFRKGDR